MTSTTTESPGGRAVSPAQRNWIFGTIVVGMLLAALDSTIVSTALPTIVGDLGGGGHMSWVVTSYLLAQTVSTVLAGKFGDLYGRKSIFIGAVVVFIVGSFFCGLANNMAWLIIARAVQGIGGGAITVTATALIADVIPVARPRKIPGRTRRGVRRHHRDRPAARRIVHRSPVVALGVLHQRADRADRHSVGAQDHSGYQRARPVQDRLPGYRFRVPRRGRGHPRSVVGGSEYDWGSVQIIGLFVGSVISFVIFVLVERRAAEPILPMHLFSQRVFTICSILSFIVGFAMMGAMTFLPTFLQYVQGTSATDSESDAADGDRPADHLDRGRRLRRKDRAVQDVPDAGSAVIALGLYLLSLMDENTSILVTSIYIFVIGLGIGLTMQVLTLVVPEHREAIRIWVPLDVGGHVLPHPRHVVPVPR